MTPPKDLFSAYLDGELADADLRRLEEWIVAEPRNAASFLEWMALQSWTHEALKGDMLEQVFQGTGPRGSDQLDAAAAVERAADTRGRGARRTWWAALAAVLLLAASSAWIVGRRPSADRNEIAVAAPGYTQQDEVIESRRESNESMVVASLTGLKRCVWQDKSSALGYGQQLTEGTQIALRSGVVRVTFESGAEAMLEGPCRFVVDNAMHGTIHRGRVSVTAPKRAYGFRIRAPNAEVIDLGTEFGVAVDDGGNSEVHVFSGEVLSRSVNRQGQQQGELIRVTANNALKYLAPLHSPSSMASDTSLFARHQAAPVQPSVGKSLPSDSRLALWLAADVSVKTQEQDRVVAWSDILYGDNTSAEDALQTEVAAQPTLVADGINDRPAVRFNGSSNYLVTTPLETTDNQTIFIVCQFGKNALRSGRKRGGQILNYNGPPHRLVSSTYEPGVLQIGEPIVEGFAPTRLGAKLFSGRLGGRDVSESEMYSSALGADVPVVLAYRYDLENHRASLWVNNELIDEKAALRPAGVTSRKVIGRHGFMKFFFAGDVGEVLIYNSALAPGDLQAVTTYLSEKYRIPLLEPGA
jgi:hypothetical protein